eukprot:CAMPEP_0197722376 /NCGR_PEP_ID=MMETSP1434-20131217/5093_1 /TAXON_ID=265543 /ORGANISM="Minutocellus polymorphus, Strain CCMP3303" /LENGTH=114 /DNA_ID=CAMNT_0043307521 /DNA_START=327 /DNA_END=671 /DNA_ORIENTATION=-
MNGGCTDVGNSSHCDNEVRELYSISNIVGIVPVNRPVTAVLPDHTSGKLIEKGRIAIEGVSPDPDPREERMLKLGQVDLAVHGDAQILSLLLTIVGGDQFELSVHDLTTSLIAQ